MAQSWGAACESTSCPPLLSSLPWRSCSPPASGTTVTDHKEMPEVLDNISCLSTTANDPPRVPAPSVHLCLKLGCLCSSLRSAVLAVPMRNTPLVWQLGAIGYPLYLVNWNLERDRSCWHGPKSSISSSTNRWHWAVEGGKSPLKMLILPSSFPSAHTVHVQWVLLPPFPFRQASSMTVDNTSLFLSGICGKK